MTTRGSSQEAAERHGEFAGDRMPNPSIIINKKTPGYPTAPRKCLMSVRICASSPAIANALILEPDIEAAQPKQAECTPSL